MHKLTTGAALIAAFCLSGSSIAEAQTQAATKYWVDVNGAAQTQTESIELTNSFPLYGETAIINTAQGVDSGGLFDISAGYRVTPQFGVSLGVSIFGDEGESSVAASIPSPVAINRPANVTATGTGLKHKEVGTSILLSYFRPITDKIEAVVSIGPVFYNVYQDFTTSSVPTGTQSLSLGSVRERARTAGVNIGANVNYFIHRNYGAGVFFRYAGANADFDSFDDLRVGGVQLGGGLRLRF
jgi:hypothetical protein